jgi:hypothetical protein
MTFTPSTIAALIVAISFSAGLNVYATIATLGILARFQWVSLPPGLDPLAGTWVIAFSCLLFCIEVFADKVPGFDLLWNFAHTVIRVPLSALLAYKAASQLPIELQLLAAVAAAIITGIAHSSKMAARALATTSPEPLSNIALSATEDGAAIGLTWFATHHPYTAAAIAISCLLALVLSIRWVFARLKHTWNQRPEWLRSKSAV